MSWNCLSDVARAFHESRSTWACELKFNVRWNYVIVSIVTLHVSVWVEMQYPSSSFVKVVSRSTWACELKCISVNDICTSYGHAPRERVSWNVFINYWLSQQMTSRSTWACELKLLYLYYSIFTNVSRSTWACELKLKSILTAIKYNVTLHVSVWVEMQIFTIQSA